MNTKPVTGNKPEAQSSSDTPENARDKRGRFLPGNDGHGGGRPLGAVDPLKQIGRKIAEQRIAAGLSARQRRDLQRAGLYTEDLTIVELIMTNLALSANPAKITMYLERTFGKTPNVNINHNDGFDFMKYKNKFTDAEMESIAEGADALEILLSKIPDIEE